MNLPIEITFCYTDIGHPLYEWVSNYNCCDMIIYSYYARQCELEPFIESWYIG